MTFCLWMHPKGDAHTCILLSLSTREERCVLTAIRVKKHGFICQLIVPWQAFKFTTVFTTTRESYSIVSKYYIYEASHLFPQDFPIMSNNTEVWNTSVFRYTIHTYSLAHTPLVLEGLRDQKKIKIMGVWNAWNSCCWISPDTGQCRHQPKLLRLHFSFPPVLDRLTNETKNTLAEMTHVRSIDQPSTSAMSVVAGRMRRGSFVCTHVNRNYRIHFSCPKTQQDMFWNLAAAAANEKRCTAPKRTDLIWEKRSDLQSHTQTDFNLSFEIQGRAAIPLPISTPYFPPHPY